MRKIFTIGETVLDILFKNGEPVTAKAGGACLNTAVSLGRLDMPVHFVGEYGIDEVGNFIEKFLQTNHVSTEYVYRYHDGKSSLALAFLNEQNDASYDFYKIEPSRHLDIEMPDIWPDDIILFGSIFAISADLRPILVELLRHARKRKAIIIYDPNFRKPHLHQLRSLLPFIEENIAMSDIVRGSNEDFALMFGVFSDKEAFHALNDKNKILLYTANKEGVSIVSNKIYEKYDTEKISPVSTIGAGDNFNAGVIYSLMEKEIGLKHIKKVSPEEWKDITNMAIKFATHVCMSYENYISEDFAVEFKKAQLTAKNNK